MDLFQDRVEEYLKKLQTSISTSPPSKYNLTKTEQRALKELKVNTDLVVRAADKWGAVVVLNGGLYRK